MKLVAIDFQTITRKIAHLLIFKSFFQLQKKITKNAIVFF